jgi:hypothetical protein
VFLRHKNNSLLAPRCTDAAGCAKVGVLVLRSRRREPAGSVAVRSGQREGPRIACSFVTLLLILYHHRAPRCSSQSFCFCWKPYSIYTYSLCRRLRKPDTDTSTSLHTSLHIRPCPGSPSTHNVTPDDLRAPSILPALHLRLSTACKESAGAMASTVRNNPHNELMSALSTSVFSQAFHLSIS